MSQSLAHRRRIIAQVVLALALAAVPWTASAAPHRTTREGANRSPAVSWAPTDVLAALKGWLTSLWAENGCILDPNGRCLQGTAPGPSTDNGCIADPNGIHCVSGAAVSPRGAVGPTTDNGCIADPDGKCKTGQ